MAGEHLTDAERAELNQWANYFSFKPTWPYKWLSECKSPVVCLFSGNQFGKGASVAKHYVDRLLGVCPVKEKNFNRTSIRKIRFLSQTLPEPHKDGGEEIKNTQYPELKKWIPNYLIRRDITSRDPVITIKDRFGGPDFSIEFSSYGQEQQAKAGQQRCVAKGQRVLKSDGSWVPIEDIKVGDELICESLGGTNRQKTNKVKNIFNNGIQDVLKFYCQKGIIFEVTGEHLIMLPGYGRASYIKAKDLKLKDRIRCRLNTIDGKKTIDDWKLILIALWLGDGHCTKYSAAVSSKSEKIKSILYRILPPNLYIRPSRENGKGTPQYFISGPPKNNEFIKILKKYDLWGKKAGTKFIPKEIFLQDDDSIRLFLKHLYATDGWASGKTIGYCSTSYRLSEDLFLLLRRLGIRSSRPVKKAFKNWKEQYWVNISQARDVIKFINDVGIYSKEEALEIVKKEALRRIKSRLDSCPFVNMGSGNITPVKQSVEIKKIECVGKKEVYDLQMEIGGWDYNIKNGKRTPMKIARSPRDNFIIQGGVVVHNCSVWIDESAPKGDYEETIPRLLAASQDPTNYIADLILSFTPEPGCIGWEFDEFYERARFVNRTPEVCKRFYKRFGYKYPVYEDRNIGEDIVVLMAATDDNPTFSKPAIDKLMEKYDDEDVIDARRYGIFRNLSGKIFKAFDPGIHVIDIWRYLDTMPHEWRYFRGIDYHQHVNWAIVWIAVSPDNEIFVYQEYNPNPDRMTTYDISREVCTRSGDYRFPMNLVDPLAGHTQTNTGRSVIQDLNDYFMDFKREGIGTGGWWEPWDTKNPVGRDEFRLRLKNSVQAVKPFAKTGLPTIWFDQSCQQTILSMKNWRIEEWANRESLLTKDEKDKPQQRWSHFPLAIECLLKRPEISMAKFGTRHIEPRRPKEYFRRPWL